MGLINITVEYKKVGVDDVNIVDPLVHSAASSVE